MQYIITAPHLGRRETSENQNVRAEKDSKSYPVKLPGETEAQRGEPSCQGDGAGRLVEQEVRFNLAIFSLRGCKISYSLFNFSNFAK